MNAVLSAWNETGEALKPWVSKVIPNFEEIVKRFTHDGFLSKQAQARFRKALGMLAWVALSRSDLTFSVSYLARGQADPRQSLEACMRSLLRWLQVGENVHKVQAFPTPNPLRMSGPEGTGRVYRCFVEHPECVWWDRDLPRDHAQDVLPKAGRAGPVFRRGGVGRHV